jgi:hypothetical protein
VQVLRVIVDQTFEQGADDVALAQAGDGLRVEARGFRHVVDDQVALGGRFLGGRPSVAAAREQERPGEQGGRPSVRGAKHEED